MRIQQPILDVCACAFAKTAVCLRETFKVKSAMARVVPAHTNTERPWQPDTPETASYTAACYLIEIWQDSEKGPEHFKPPNVTFNA